MGTGLRPVRDGAQRRGYIRKKFRAERMRPIWNLNFTGARKGAQLDHGHAALRILAKIDKYFVGCERPRDHFVGRFGVVRKPNGGGRGGSCLLANLLGEDRGAISAFGEKNAAGQSGYTGTDDGDLFRHLKM